MSTVSARLPKELADELEEYVETEGLETSVAVRRLLAEGLAEWRRERALERLDAGEITFMRAAELADMNPWSFADLIRDADVTWVDEEGIREDLDAV